MGEFFKGWRRKIGVLTLVMACVMMGAWVRSFGRMELIHICPGRSLVIIGSRNGSLCLMRSVYQTHEVAISKSITIFNSSLKRIGVGCSSEKSSDETNIKYWTKENWPVHDTVSQSYWTFGGFLFGTESHTTISDEHDELIAMAPYWSIVVPLTLISLWILLCNPRDSTPKKIAERNSEKVV